MTPKELQLQGAHAVVNAIQEGRCLGKEMTFLAKFIRTGQTPIFNGAVAALLSAALAVRDSGQLQQFADDDLNEFFFGKDFARMGLELSETYHDDPARYERLLSYMAGIVNTYRHTLRLSMPDGTVTPANPNVLDVRIVGVPTTTSIQSVERDEADEITRTLTITKQA